MQTVRTLEQADIAGLRKALEDCEAEKKLVEEDYKIRVAELSRRMDLFQEENKKLKGDLLEMKSKHRELEMEYNGTIRKINEKDVTIKNLELLKTNLLKELENERVRFDAVTSELDNLQVDFDSKTKTTVAVEMTVKELKRQRDEISKEKEDLSKHLVELSRRLASEIKRGDDAEYIMQRIIYYYLLLFIIIIFIVVVMIVTFAENMNDIGRMEGDLLDNEKQILALRQQNDESDTKLATLNAKISNLENCQASSAREIQKLTELNAKLQQEKQDIMSLKQKCDVMVDLLKDKLRKMDVEMEKLKGENRELQEREDAAQKQQKEDANKVHQLAMELKEAGAEIQELERKLAQVAEDDQLRLQQTRQASSDQVTHLEVTEITETKVKQLGDKHKLEIEKLENDKKRIEDLQDHEGTLRAELKDWQEKHAVTHKELQTVRDQLENEHRDSEKEIQKWKTELYTVQMELKNFEAANETQKSQLAIASERGAALNKTVTEQSGRIRELNAQVRRLEESLSDVNSTL
ncbi:unnamed protein product, partial [Anisakis simplex]|uniref:GRIP domain-containing protein n=1 Tax=Anisakis simplex TaxID=6269 RepID=A0A0M3KD72_ANISI